MNGLLFLESDDFHITKGNRGDVMATDIPGFSLLLFYSTACEHCHKVIPIFKRLPGSIGGCQFGMINVSNNKECVMMSNKTIAPIKYVPYILFYVNGKPFMRYNGEYDLEQIRKFVVEVAVHVKSNQQFTKEKDNPNTRNKIPMYSVGQPLYGDPENVCYLEFSGAYK